MQRRVDETAGEIYAVAPMTQALFRGIIVVSISVPDLGRARIFYRDALGLGEPIYDLPDANWIEFSTGGDGANLAITAAGADWRPSTGTTVVLNVDDCVSAVAELRRRGIACDDAEEFPGFVVFASFYDPFGNRLQICSPAPEAA